ncbi:putative hydrolase [Frankia canadensis]|uniref:Putative hydrolase n=1 Tax=Frankia canadensis TaxID=1836972 RepID=A0A2I2KK20_9ACTN|nr:alpha/beta hydrolase [Frankia canadensis]SNQ45994.1 putative hydrolase [Frankia canadensis]SOU53284.1 putative hydrolase [Frankia canadensis]
MTNLEETSRTDGDTPGVPVLPHPPVVPGAPVSAVSGQTAEGHRSYWAQLGGPVHFVDFGGPATAPLLLCVHGLGGSHLNWLPLAPLLTASHRVLAVDLAGHGRTPAAGRRTDVAANQRLLDRFLAEVLAVAPVLVGNSMGGMISLLQAGHRPDSVAGMILVDPALPRPRGVRPDPEIARLFAGLFVPWVGTAVLAHRRTRYTPGELVEQSLRRICADPARVPASARVAMERAQRERDGLPDADQAFVAAARSVVWSLLRAAPLSRLVRTVPHPTLLLHGTADRLIPVAVARDVAARRPDWRVEILDGLGHVPMIEDADRTATLIQDWLSGEGRVAADRARPAPGPGAATGRPAAAPTPAVGG